MMRYLALLLGCLSFSAQALCFDLSEFSENRVLENSWLDVEIGVGSNNYYTVIFKVPTDLSHADLPKDSSLQRAIFALGSSKSSDAEIIVDIALREENDKTLGHFIVSKEASAKSWLWLEYGPCKTFNFRVTDMIENAGETID